MPVYGMNRRRGTDGEKGKREKRILKSPL